MKNILITATALSLTLGTAMAGNTKTVTDHAGNTVEIPTNPKRIASMHTTTTSVMLTELGAPIIGTATRIKKSTKKPYIRGVEEVFGVKFEDTGYYNYGKAGKDLEQLKASKPDLIVATTRKHKKIFDKLSAIAPTVLVETEESQRILDIYGDLASWVGKKDVFDTKYNAYQKHLKSVQAKFGGNGKTFVYALPYVEEGSVRVLLNRGALTKVAYDLGLKQLDFVNKNVGDTEEKSMLSPELIGKLNANYFITTYSERSNETAETVYKDFEKLAPGWKKHIGKNSVIVPFNREVAGVSAFKGFTYTLEKFEKLAK